MDSFNKITMSILILVVVFFTGFITSRCTISTEVVSDTTYIELPSKVDTIIKIEYKDKIVPNEISIDSLGVAEYLYKQGKLDYLKDTLLVVDTVEILKEFTNINNYKFNAFRSDTLGELNIDLDVQFNELSRFSYEYLPTQKVVNTTRTNRPSVEFMVGAGLGVRSEVNPILVGNFSAGVFIKSNYGIEYIYQRDYKKNNTHNLMFKYKF